MKKHNEGYVLPFVLVVLVVVCIVALSLMGAALGNLQRQQASIARMEARYTAQGEIEQAIAKWNNDVNRTYEGKFPPGTAEENKNVEYAAELVLREIFGTDISVTWTDEEFEYSRKEIDLGRSPVTAAVTVSVMIKENEVILYPPTEGVALTYDFEVRVTGSVNYDSYTISNEGGGPQ